MIFSVVRSRNSTHCGAEGQCPEGTSCVRPALFNEPHFCLANEYRLGSFQTSPNELYCPKQNEIQFSTAVWVCLLWLTLFIGFLLGQCFRIHTAASSRSRNTSRDSTPLRFSQPQARLKCDNEYIDY